MMEFTKIGSNDWVALNSLKITNIRLEYNGYMLHTPEGGLLDEFKTRGPFVDFDSAKRNAEMNVGVSVNFEDKMEA